MNHQCVSLIPCLAPGNSDHETFPQPLHVHVIMSTISTYTGIQRMSPLQET